MNDHLTCSDVEALVPAYVLSALEGDEACAFAHHLVECRLHDEDLAAERLMATRLGVSVNAVAPPSTLRSNLLSAFDKEMAGTPVALEPAREKRRGFSFLRAPSFAYGIAAAVAMIALALGAWGVSRGAGDDAGVSGVRTATARSNGMRLDVTYFGSEQVAVLSYDLPPPPSGKTYQAWKIASGKPVSLGLINANGPLTVNADLKDASAVAISEEPSGGSPQPTKVLVASQF
jgi:anti-sigma-K factor RskA